MKNRDAMRCRGCRGSGTNSFDRMCERCGGRGIEIDASARLRYCDSMSDETQAMRVTVSLDNLDMNLLAAVMAEMPLRSESGELRSITPAQALLYLLRNHKPEAT